MRGYVDKKHLMVFYFFRLNMIRDLPKLKQLDLSAISASEKRDVGLEVSSDEDDDDDEEGVEVNNERGKFGRLSVK